MVITNVNEDGSPQFQALSPPQDHTLMGVLCEIGKLMKTLLQIYFKPYIKDKKMNEIFCVWLFY